MMNQKSNRLPMRATLVAAMFLATSSAVAQTHLFLPNAGAWEDFNNWSFSAVPGGIPWQVAAITNGGTATLSGSAPNPDVVGTGELNEVWVGNDNGAGNLVLNAGANLHVWQWLAVGRTAFASVTDGHANATLTVGDPGNVTAVPTLLNVWQLEVGQSWNVGGDTAASTNARVILGGNTNATFLNRISIGTGDFAPRTSSGPIADGTLTLRDHARIVQTGFDGSDQVAVGHNSFNSFAPGSGSGNKGTLNLLDNSQMSIISGLRVGQFDGANGTVNLSNNATLTVDPNVEDYFAVVTLGDWSFFAGNRTKGVINQSGTSTFTVGNAAVQPGEVIVGYTGDGAYNLSGGTINASTRRGTTIGHSVNPNSQEIGAGTMTVTGGTANLTGLIVGKYDRATGTVTQSGGTVNVGLNLGAAGDFSMNNLGLVLGGIEETGGVAVNDAAPATGTYNLSGGTLHTASAIIGDHGRGILTVSGSGVLTSNNGIIVARERSHEFDGGTRLPSSGTVNLNGGTINTPSLSGGTGNSVVHFNGGVLKATADNATFISNLTTAVIDAGGAKIDSNGFEIATAQAFTGTGSLTKQGAGRLTLTAAVGHTGGTNVTGGTLRLSGAAQSSILTATGDVDIRSGRLELDYSAATSPSPTIVPILTAGFAQSTQFSSGKIKSSTATASRGLGWIDDATNKVFTVAYAIYGDTNLDGAVNFTDLLKLAQNYGATTGGKWANGDLNYDGAINFPDLLRLAQNYGGSLAVDGADILDAGVPTAFSNDFALALSMVPEPASAIVMLGIGAMTRRRRIHRA